jgi:hypothetical protein
LHGLLRVAGLLVLRRVSLLLLLLRLLRRVSLLLLLLLLLLLRLLRRVSLLLPLLHGLLTLHRLLRIAGLGSGVIALTAVHVSLSSG